MTLSLTEALKLPPVELEIHSFKQQARTGGHADKALKSKNHGPYWLESDWSEYERKTADSLRRLNQAGRISELTAVTAEKRRRGELIQSH